MKAIVNSALATIYGNGLDKGESLAVDGLARPLVNVSTAQSGAGYFGKLHDGTQTTGDLGFAVFGVRRDTVGGFGTGAGKYSSFAVDAAERTITAPFAPPQVTFQFTNAAAITTTTSTQIIAADASNRLYVTDLSITNESAVATRVDLLDGSTVIWRAHVKAGDSYRHNFTVPVRTTSNTALNAQCATTATSTFVSVSGFRAGY